MSCRLSALRRAALALVLAAGLLVGQTSCGGGGGGHGGGGGGGGSGGANNLASVLPSPTEAALSEWVGSFAADYLRDTFFTQLVVQVAYAVSYPPSDAALQLLHDRLAERCRKPDGVTILLGDAIADTEFKATLDVPDLEALEDAHRTVYSNQATKVAAAFLMYVKGSSVEDGPNGVVLGLSYRAGSTALFTDNIGPGDPARTSEEIEGTGVTHELGHLLGMVDIGVPKLVEHEDAAHPAHCDNQDCLMYWQIRIPFLTPNIGDPDFAQFDAHCIADMQAFGGK